MKSVLSVLRYVKGLLHMRIAKRVSPESLSYLQRSRTSSHWSQGIWGHGLARGKQSARAEKWCSGTPAETSNQRAYDHVIQ